MAALNTINELKRRLNDIENEFAQMLKNPDLDPLEYGRTISAKYKVLQRIENRKNHRAAASSTTR